MRVFRRFSLIAVLCAAAHPLCGCAPAVAPDPDWGRIAPEETPSVHLVIHNRERGDTETPEPGFRACNGVMIGPGLLLTAAHAYPIGSVSIDGVRTFIRTIVAHSDGFGIPKDWVVVRTSVDGVYPRAASRPIRAGDRGVIVGRASASGQWSGWSPEGDAVPAGWVPPVASDQPVERIPFEVIPLPSRYPHALRDDVLLRVPVGSIEPGFSGSPAYRLDADGRAELIGTVSTGRALRYRVMGMVEIHAGEVICGLTPLAEEVAALMERR